MVLIKSIEKLRDLLYPPDNKLLGEGLPDDDP